MRWRKKKSEVSTLSPKSASRYNKCDCSFNALERIGAKILTNSQRFQKNLICLLLGVALSASFQTNCAPVSAQNLPSGGEAFKQNFQECLETYFATSSKGKVSISYELLRRVPTVSGVSAPKYYAWAKVMQDGKTLSEGAVRVAEYDDVKFDVTNFASQKDINSGAAKIEDTFPAALCPEIRRRAAAGAESK